MFSECFITVFPARDQDMNWVGLTGPAPCVLTRLWRLGGRWRELRPSHRDSDLDNPGGNEGWTQIEDTVSYEPNYFLEVDFDQNDAPEWTTLPERGNKMGPETVEINKIGCVIFK